MKITPVLLFTFIFSLSAVTSSSQNVKVTINRAHSSVQEVIRDIEKQTEYLFIVNSNVDTRRSVSIDASGTPLSEVLDKLAGQAEVSYSVAGSHIILSKEAQGKDAAPIPTQQPVIRGVVMDESGEALIGVNVKVKGESQGAISDIEGNFELAASVGNTLVFSYVGYITEN
ncbi:MAG: carboxypeptidase-like regulatory domain-containing protein [Bacteroides sp.]|nr:carboxypeptidase-like regulatory domain-containing protein [Bacteroides sp.]